MTPKAISEWNDPDGRTDDCGWRSTTMVANKASLGAYPATQAESERLGAGASTIDDNNAALGRVYGFTGTALTGVTWAEFTGKLQAGFGAVLQGYYSALPRHFQRFDRAFAAKGIASYHAVYVERSPTGTIWWIDPLFHGEPGYSGEVIPVSALAAYATAYHTSVHALLVREGSHSTTGGSQQGADVIPAPITDEIPVEVRVNPRVPLLDLDGKTVLVPESIALPWRPSPYGVGPKLRAIYATIGGVRRTVLTDPAESRPLPALADCTAQVAAEHERTRQQAIAAVEAIP